MSNAYRLILINLQVFIIYITHIIDIFVSILLEAFQAKDFIIAARVNIKCKKVFKLKNKKELIKVWKLKVNTLEG